MSDEIQIQQFLQDFKAKLGIWGIFFRDDRGKNAQALLDLEISVAFRQQVLKELEVCDYSEGPIDDFLYGKAAMWVFGKHIKSKEVYIKITMGTMDARVICISFHIAEHKMKYPYK